jgi:hypothetical protein
LIGFYFTALFVFFRYLIMNYVREILACGHVGICGGQYLVTFQKERPIPRVIRFDLLQMHDDDDEADQVEVDDDDHLAGLAFVEDTTSKLHQKAKTSFEAFMELEESESEEQSAWSSFASASVGDEDDSYHNWNKASPVSTDDSDGSSYATRNTSNISFSLGEKKRTMQASHKKASPKQELSQGTMVTASTQTISVSNPGYFEI